MQFFYIRLQSKFSTTTKMWNSFDQKKNYEKSGPVENEPAKNNTKRINLQFFYTENVINDRLEPYPVYKFFTRLQESYNQSSVTSSYVFLPLV